MHNRSSRLLTSGYVTGLTLQVTQWPSTDIKIYGNYSIITYIEGKRFFEKIHLCLRVYTHTNEHVT